MTILDDIDKIVNSDTTHIDDTYYKEIMSIFAMAMKQRPGSMIRPEDKPKHKPTEGYDCVGTPVHVGDWCIYFKNTSGGGMQRFLCRVVGISKKQVRIQYIRYAGEKDFVCYSAPTHNLVKITHFDDILQRIEEYRKEHPDYKPYD